METQEYLNEMKMVQNSLLAFLENSGELSDNYDEDLTTLLDSDNIRHHQHKIKSILYLLSKVSNAHHRSCNLINKIEQIIEKLRHRIKHYFKAHEIFNIFKGNKRILVFLFEKNIITIDQEMAKFLTSDDYTIANYTEYFFTELKPFLPQSTIDGIEKNLPEDFQVKRKSGENDDYICELIRNDFIHEFIDYTKKTNLPLNSKVKPSIYETHNFLIKNQTDLIEYAAYLYPNLNNVKSKIWFYAIHGQNAEIIYFLKENDLKIKHKDFALCVRESIKCHHIAITNFILQNFKDKAKTNHVDVFAIAMKFYNFYFIDNNFKNPSVFYHLCKYDYYHIVHILIKKKEFLSSHEKTQNSIFVFNSIFF